jgi:hypothetical protein
MLHAMQQAIEPTIPLQSVVSQWSQIEMDLQERSRRRVPQITIR